MTTPTDSPAGVPITPGTYSDSAPIWPPQTYVRPPRRRLTTVIAVVVSAVLAAGVAVGVVAFLDWRTGGGPTQPQASEDVTALEAAAELCDDREQYGGEIGDGGRSLDFDMQGQDDFSGGDISALLCVLHELDTPDFVISLMESTRALDGRQSAEWEGYEASWTYHPDDGLDVIIRMV